MAKPKGKRGLGLSALKAVEAGRRSAEADLRVEEHNARHEGMPHLLSIESIGERPSADVRPVDAQHVQSLVESIRALGLMQPVFVDREHRLIAGAHRLAAFRILAQEDPSLFGKIPVVVDPNLDAEEDVEQALLKEIAENEKRRNLTPQQVQEAARRLMEYDAHFTRRAGRLKQGERPLTPFLASTFGVSVRHVRSLLNESIEANSEDQPSMTTSEEFKAFNPSFEESNRCKLTELKLKVKRRVKSWLKDPVLEQDPALQALLMALLERAERPTED